MNVEFEALLEQAAKRNWICRPCSYKINKPHSKPRTSIHRAKVSPHVGICKRCNSELHARAKHMNVIHNNINDNITNSVSDTDTDNQLKFPCGIASDTVPLPVTVHSFPHAPAPRTFPLYEHLPPIQHLHLATLPETQTSVLLSRTVDKNDDENMIPAQHADEVEVNKNEEENKVAKYIISNRDALGRITVRSKHGRHTNCISIPTVQSNLADASKSTQLRAVNSVDNVIKIIVGQLSATSDKFVESKGETHRCDDQNGGNDIVAVADHNDKKYFEDNIRYLLRCIVKRYESIFEKNELTEIHESMNMSHVLSAAETVQFIINMGLTMNKWIDMKSTLRTQHSIDIFSSEKEVRAEFHRVSHDVETQNFNYQHEGK